MIHKEASLQTGHVRVTFEIPASIRASRIHLVGDFNHWDTGAMPFQRMADGVWRITLDLPARRCYEFRYLIDDHWWTDNHADGCTANGPGSNSIVFTNLPVENLATSMGHGMVHEEALNHRIDFARRQRM